MPANAQVTSVGSEVVKANTVGSQSVLLICVKYGGDKETERYLDSIQALQCRAQLYVMVIDNNADDNWATPSLSAFEVVKSPGNLGYLGGARYGLSLYLRQNPLPDWIIISNVDLSIDDPLFLERLESLRSVPDLGAVAPSIRSSRTGIDQNPFLRARPSALRMRFYKWLSINWLTLNSYELLGFLFDRVRGAIGRVRGGASSLPPRERIYAPHGSFLIFAKNYFDRGGTLDFPQFLFGEEIYIAEHMRRLALEVVYEPFLQITHQEHHSTKLFKSRAVAKHWARSAAYCADTLFSRSTQTDMH